MKSNIGEFETQHYANVTDESMRFAGFFEESGCTERSTVSSAVESVVCLCDR